MMDERHGNKASEGNSFGGLLLIGALTASYRLRRWAGLAAVWMIGLGSLLLIIAASLHAQDILPLPLAAMGIGAVVGLCWLISTFLAWIVRIIVEDTSKGSTKFREDDR
jgi:hypothetical protein